MTPRAGRGTIQLKDISSNARKGQVVAKKEDDRLELRISNKLGNIGLRAPCRIQVEVYNGQVRLKGKVLFDYQKKAAITAVRSMDHVTGIIDELKVEAPVRAWDDAEPPKTDTFVPPPETE
jgi:osmotically-inducible protein OsmY